MKRRNRATRSLPRRQTGGLTPDALDALIRSHRSRVERTLKPLIRRYYPGMLAASGGLEYRKMIELSSKMTMVGRACRLIAGYPFDARRLRISILFGACCFLGDSFLDDFGEAASLEYLKRCELLRSEDSRV